MELIREGAGISFLSFLLCLNTISEIIVKMLRSSELPKAIHLKIWKNFWDDFLQFAQCTYVDKGLVSRDASR